MAYRLSKANYFSPERPHISVSQIRDYVRSPGLYKRKYIDRDPELEFKVTPSMQRGLVVDELLTSSGPMQYVKKVLKKEDPEEYERQRDMDDRYLVPEVQWRQAIEIAERVSLHPVWVDNIESAKFQVVLAGKLEGLKVCGMADRIDCLGADDANHQRYRLIDLKVVNPIKIASKDKWYFNCVQMNYLHQLAMYQWLWAQKKKVDLANIECAHVVCAWEDNVVKVRAYRFGQPLLDKAFSELCYVLQDIKAGRFEDEVIDWGASEMIAYE